MKAYDSNFYLNKSRLDKQSQESYLLEWFINLPNMIIFLTIISLMWSFKPLPMNIFKLSFVSPNKLLFMGIYIIV